MAIIRTCVLSLVSCLLFISMVKAVPLTLFYPFGTDAEDKILQQGDDISSDPIELEERFVFYNNSYRSIYVNMNGHVSFDSELPAYRGDLKLPLGFHVIAVFLADVDTSSAGTVFYRSTSESSVIQRAASDIQTHFSGFESYMPTSLFIVTWDKVGYYPAKRDKLNTFQLVLASDGLDSFAIFHYLDGGMQWMTSEAKIPNRMDINDVPPQAGFENGEGGQLYTLPGSAQTGTFATGTNVNAPGVWMYHIGDVGFDNVRPADASTAEVTVFDVGSNRETCFTSSRRCHPNAQCMDNALGFCCECIQPFYGNGFACLERENNQRLYGPVQGTLNGRNLDILFYAHVMTKDGRTHYNIYPLPEDLGQVMATLTSIGGIAGWLFAKPGSPRALSGYSFTGDKFNRTAIVTYQSTEGGNNKQVRISQFFQGHDAPDKIRMLTRVEGEVPEIPIGADVTIDDYTENYKRTAPGIIKSFVARVYRVNGVAYRYTWDNTIEYDECYGGALSGFNDIMRLSAARHYAVYDKRAEVVRYALTTKVGTMGGADPCSESENPCGPNADCVPNGDTFTCLCMPGFSDRGGQCEDVDECVRSPCDENASCFNTIGTYQCRCNPGFTGDGRTCRDDVQLCGEDICASNARCVFIDDFSQPRCVCNEGFRGNGLSCAPTEYDCRDANICHENAQCIYDDDLREYVCECMDEFSGDGYSCDPYINPDDCSSCDRFAQCVTDITTNRVTCQCRPGYTGNGYTCSLIDTCASCDRNARCMFDDNISDYRCVCVRGYEGDGTQCVQRDCREFEGMCAAEGGLCWLNPQTNVAICRCNYGYRGDGFTCERVGCDVYNDCDGNAKCMPVEDRFECVCNEGFVGDGKRCRDQTAGCDVLNDCDANARCVAVSSDPPRYECRCSRGFQGDGKTCVEVDVPCNQVNNCDRNAQCMYDPDRMSYRCVCTRGFEGDGRYCQRREVIDCRRERRLCSENAECVQGATEEYVCVCKPGFRGDGASCSAVVREGNYLIYAQGRKLMKVPSEPNTSEHGMPIVYMAGQLAVGVDTDCNTGQLYWTDAAQGVIRRSNLNGTNIETVIADLKSPEGIAIDFSAGNLFFTDSEMDTVMVSRLDGTNMKTLADTRMVNPRAIVLDISKGVVYWTDWNRNRPQIERMNMDGSERSVLVSEGLRLPNGLAFDSFSQTLCWGDAGTKSIECVRSDGVGRRVVTENANYPFDITLLNNVVYWTDWTRKDIPNVNQSGGDNNQPLRPALGGNGKLYGITAIKDRCPRESNSCALRKGGCEYLCLPTPNGGRTCACPDGVDPRLCTN